MTQLKSNLQIPLILLIMFLDFVGFGILIPIGPVLLTDPHSSAYILGNTAQSTAYIIFGLLLATYPLMLFLAAPILGQLSDKFGRKPILTYSLSGTMLSYLLFGLGIISKDIPLLFLARAIDGITGANLVVAQAVLADSTDPSNRARVFGYIGAALGAGITLGPFLGGILSDPSLVQWFNSATPFWFTAVLSFCNVVLIRFFFKETLVFPKSNGKIRFQQSFLNIAKAFSLSDLRTLFVTSFLFSGGFTFYQVFVPVFLNHRFNFTQSNIGSFFFYSGLWIIFSQAVGVRFVTKRFPEASILGLTLPLLGFCILLYCFQETWWYLLLIIPFFACFNALSSTSIVSLVSKSAGPNIQGEILGINGSVQALAQSVAIIVGGFFAATVTYWTPLIISSVVIFLAATMFYIFYRLVPKSSTD